MELAAAAGTRKDMDKLLLRMVVLLPQIFPVRLAGVQAQPQEREACIGVNNQSYFCETGHCCGESQCCNYYYELWWFWLVWTIIIILSCCCICHHRRAKLRLQQQQRQREINLIAYQGARNYSLLPLYLRGLDVLPVTGRVTQVLWFLPTSRRHAGFLPSYLLPPYEEVVNRPVTPPPPYSAFHQQSATACNGSSNPEPSRAPATPGNSVPTVCEVVPRQGSMLGLDSPHAYSECSLNKVPACDQPEDPVAGSQQEQVRACCLDLEEVLDCPEKEQLTDYYPSSSSKIESWHHQSCLEIKDIDKTPGRHRRFTGDSGIEVCICNRGDDPDDPKELDGLIDTVGSAMEFCDSCNICDSCPRQDTREEAPSEGQEQRDHKEQRGPEVTEEPVYLVLDTINENELLQAHQHQDPQT
ncbi:WW domain binding protein 1-like a [Pristis pectinata]|uniref:WW domain binding protein 1-like a n=1 Tax=Pristis pectinata TaxID=685728 RepID=UPI00223CDD25|nr:WW domain binding protein 1-like a [Pristis pectinata]